jgi:hypothetical protein
LTWSNSESDNENEMLKEEDQYHVGNNELENVLYRMKE